MLAMMGRRGAFVEDVIVYYAFKKVFPAEIVVEFGNDQPDGADQEKFAEE